MTRFIKYCRSSASRSVVSADIIAGCVYLTGEKVTEFLGTSDDAFTRDKYV